MTVFGVGINDLKSPIKIKGVHLPFYVKWVSMLERCYSEKKQEKYPTYKGCTVCDEWLLLSNFKRWYDKQYYVKGFHLDKDILVPNNKVYSPETCRFVPRVLNNLINTCSKKSNRLVGVNLNYRVKDGEKEYIKSKPYRSQCDKVLTKGRLTSTHKTEIEAHNAWRKNKSEVIRQVVSKIWNDYPQLDLKLRDALLLRAEKLLDYNLKIEEFY